MPSPQGQCSSVPTEQALQAGGFVRRAEMDECPENGMWAPFSVKGFQ